MCRMFALLVATLVACLLPQLLATQAAPSTLSHSSDPSPKPDIRKFVFGDLLTVTKGKGDANYWPTVERKIDDLGLLINRLRTNKGVKTLYGWRAGSTAATLAHYRSIIQTAYHQNRVAQNNPIHRLQSKRQNFINAVTRLSADIWTVGTIIPKTLYHAGNRLRYKAGYLSPFHERTIWPNLEKELKAARKEARVAKHKLSPSGWRKWLAKIRS